MNMAVHDAEVFAALGAEGLGEVMAIGSNQIPGVFVNRYRELETRDGGLVGLELSFDCQITDAVRNLADGDEVEIRNAQAETGAAYRFVRRVPDAGDESGLVTVELGRKL